MGNYQYIARSADGQEVTGVMEAENEAAVVRSLDERKLFPVRVFPQAPAREMIRHKVQMRDVGVVYGQLSDLLRSGVPMLRSLEILVRTATRKRLMQVLTKVKDDVSAGKTLADAMAQHPAVFTTLHCAMVRAGERAGFLEEVLANLASFIERQDELRGKVRGAMVYPIILCVLGVLLLTGILVFLVPRFKPLFSTMSLPAPTVLLFALSDLLVDHLAVFVAILVLLVVGTKLFLQSHFGRAMWDRWRLKVPVVGFAMRMVSITRFCRILGTMLANGVPILQALDIAKDAAGSEVLTNCIATAAENVRRGDPLAQPLRQSGLFPSEIVEMIAVAEESNQLEKVLVQIADTVERRTNRQVDQAVRLIEPIILVVLGLIIGFIATGLFYPIFNMGQAFRK